MLLRLQESAKGWFTWIILGLIALTFVLVGTSASLSSDKDQVLAKVNGHKIHASELAAHFERLIHQPGNEALNSLDPALLKREIFNQLINDALLSQSAKQMKMCISDERLVTIIESLPFLQSEGKFSELLYQQYLRNANYTSDEFLNFMKGILLKRQLQQGIMGGTFVMPDVVSEVTRLFHQKRTLRFAVVVKDSFKRHLTVSEDELKKIYDARPKDFMTPEEVSLSYITLSLPQIAALYHPTDEALTDFYEENKSFFSTPARVKARHILISVLPNADKAAVDKAKARLKEVEDKLKQGAQFGEVAKNYSDDKPSAEKGGDLDWFSEGEMVPAFEKQAFALNKGEQSKPVKTEFGWHIILVEDKQEKVVPTFESIKDNVMQKAKEQWAKEKFSETADEITSLAEAHPESLQPISDKLNLPIQQSSLFDKANGPKETELQNPSVLNAAFSVIVKDSKNNSDLIPIDDEHYVIVRVKDRIASKRKPLSLVSADIYSEQLDQKARLMAKKVAETLMMNEQKNHKDNKMIPQEVKWQVAPNLTRMSKQINPEILQAGFSLAKNNHVFKLLSLSNGDSVVLTLDKVTESDDKDLSKDDNEKFSKSLVTHLGELDYGLFETYLLKSAKIEKYNDKDTAKKGRG